jgi:hypothetical protein
MNGRWIDIHGKRDQLNIAEQTALTAGYSTYLLKSHHVCEGFMPQPD